MLKKPIVLAGIAAVALIAVAYFVVLPMMKSKPAATAAADSGGEPAATAAARRAKRQPEPGLIYPLKERILNLASEGGQPHFARIELALEFSKPEGYKAPQGAAGAKAKTTETPIDPSLEPVTARMAQINDALVRIVGSKSLEIMTSTEGKESLKKEVMTAIDDIVPKPDLLAVYIINLVVQ